MNKIIRNNNLTRILGADVELRLPTKKYDDIVGIDPKSLPIFEDFKDDELYEAVEFNNQTISINALLEYSDMNYDLYRSSVFGASSKFDFNLKYNWKIKSDILSSFVNMPTQYTNRDISIIPLALTKEYRRDVPITNIRRLSRTVNFAVDPMIKETVVDSAESIIGHYHKIIKNNKIKLFDNEGNTYDLPKLELQEIVKIMEEYIAENMQYDIVSGNIHRICGDRFVDVIIKTKTWKYFQLGMLYLMKNGEPEDLVDFTELKLEKDYLWEKSRGKYPKLIKSDRNMITWKKTGN